MSAAITTVRWVEDSRYSWLLTAIIWCLVILMIVPDNLDYGILTVASASPSSGGEISRSLWLMLLSLGLVVTMWRAALGWLLLRWLNPFLLLFAALALVSCLWSIEPTVTARRLIRVFTILLDSLAFVLMGWNAQRLQQALRPILTTMLVGSIIFGLTFPALAIHQETSAELMGAWRGLTNHKNSLGALSCITLILWAHALLARQASLVTALSGMTLAACCLLLSRSSTSLVTSVIVIAFLLLLLRMPQGLRRYTAFLIASFVALLMVYSLAMLNLVPGLDVLFTPITMLTGKDTTFTGRSDIWAIIIEHIRLHPWLGTGYGAYWTGPYEGTPSFEFITQMEFYPGSAHNGYLEIANDLGLVGLLFLLGYIVVFANQALRLFHIDRSQGALYLGLFLQQSLSNLSETHWLSVMSVNFVIMTLATTALARGLMEPRLVQYFGSTPLLAQTVDGHVDPS